MNLPLDGSSSSKNTAPLLSLFKACPNFLSNLAILSKASGKAHEDGGQISLAELRGSAAIAQLSDMVIGLERDQQNADPQVRNTTTVRVLKNRYAGLTGAACYLFYDRTLVA